MFENNEGAIKKGQPEKLAPQGTQGKKTITQHTMCWTSLCANKIKLIRRAL